MATALDRIRDLASRRVVRDLEVAGIGIFAALAFAEVWLYLPRIDWHPGWDFDVCHATASRFMSGGSYFPERQLGGPYLIGTTDVLYPPVALWLFVPFLALPAQLWWLIPAAITVAALWRLRPSITAWLAIAILMAQPHSGLQIVNGNPSMWVVAILSASAAWGAPSSLMLFKPSLAPLALFRARDRRWLFGLAALALLSLPFAGLNLTWVQVVLNARNPLGWAYSLHELAFVMVPLVAYVGRDRARDRARNAEALGGTVRSGMGLPS